MLATAAAIAGRHDDVAQLAATVIDDPAASDAAVALAERAWALAARADDPARRRPPLRARRGRRQPRRLRVVGLGGRRLPGRRARPARETARPRSTRWPMCSGAGTNPTTCSWSCSPTSCAAGCCCGAATSTGAEAELAEARSRSAAMGQPWWTAAVLRTAAAVASFGPGGWDGSRRAVAAGGRLRRQPRGARRGCDHACARRRRRAQHLGEHEQAAVLLGRRAAIDRRSPCCPSCSRRRWPS